jgi:hypothetical protein
MVIIYETPWGEGESAQSTHIFNIGRNFMSTNYDMVSIIFTFWKEIDTGNDRVQKFNSNGGFITKCGIWSF